MELRADDKLIGTIRAGTPEARAALAPGLPRKFTARAAIDIEYIVIDSDLLDVLLTWDQTGQYEVAELRGDGLDVTGDWMTTLLQTKAFHRIPPANIQAIFMRMQRINYRAGDVVIKQGTEGDYFYVVVAGKCVVTRETPLNKEGIKLAEFGPGDSFGEEALIAEAKRNATVTMSTDGTLMRLGKNRLSNPAQRAAAAMGGLRQSQGNRRRRRQMAGRAPAQRIPEFSHRRRGQYSAVLHPPEAQRPGQEHPVRGVLRHGPPQLRRGVHLERARLRSVCVEGRPCGHRGRTHAARVSFVPRVFRGEEPRGPGPGDLQEYRARSMIEEYRGLAIVFAVLGLALAAYFIKSMLAGPKPPPPPVQSVYIETVPAQSQK